jgi:hypothetical protein
MKQQLFHARRNGLRPMTRLTRAEIAANRRVMIKAWVLSTLPPAEIAAALESPMPPTITELIARARLWAAEHPCPNCGHVIYPGG